MDQRIDQRLIGYSLLERARLQARQVTLGHRGSTLRDHRQTDGELGYFQHSFVSYGKEGAACPRPRCPGTIARIAQAGRSTFYCPVCQR